MKPKKSLGQNFLTSIPARNTIVDAGEIKSGETVLEIGPGKGMLTDALLGEGAKVIAIEKDHDLIPILSDKFKNEIQNQKLVLINEDILKFDISSHKLQTTNYKLIANIPYNITGAIIEKFLTEKIQPDSIVILIQKEVAERIVTRDKKESILSLSVKAYGEPAIVCRVNKGSFYPVPSVDSAVLRIKNISRKNFANGKEEGIFFDLIKNGFAHKRKLLISNLKEIKHKTNWEETFMKNNVNLKTRAEDLTINDWLNITKEIASVNN